MALGMDVGLGPGDIVLDGDAAPPPQKRSRGLPIFGPFLLWPNGWMHQDTTWHGGRPRHRPHCDRWGSSSHPLPKNRRWDNAPNFRPCLLWPNGRMHQDTTYYGGRPQPRGHCVRWGSSPLPKKGAKPPIFGPCLMRPNGCMDQDATW